MIENIRLSLTGIWSHKMRSFLTMLGIIIGIAAIIAIVSTIKGTNEQIKQNLVGSGNNTVEVKLNQGGYEIEGSEAPFGTKVMELSIISEILTIPEVESASLYLNRSYADSVYYQNKSLEGGSIKGIDSNYLKTTGYVIKSGRGFIEKDYQDFLKNVLIDENVANNLFQGNNPVGQIIEIKGEPFTVIGVVEESVGFEPVINSIDDYYLYQQDRSGVIFMTDSAWPITYGFDEPKNLMVKAVDTDSMSEAGRKSADVLNAYMGDSQGVTYAATDILEQAKQLQELSAATNQQLLWIASISLIVGGIGVMNIMLVSVTERTSEIGLKKAIGARKKVILAQFLTEAAVLTSLGGILGVLAGLSLAQVISHVSNTPVAISIPAIMASVFFSMVIGVVFGLLPSIKAANLNPIDALRYE